jgi:hypothetical protein
MLPDGVVRSNRKNTTPLILFEAIAIGVADALKGGTVVDAQKLKDLLDNKTLTTLTTGATNSRKNCLKE